MRRKRALSLLLAVLLLCLTAFPASAEEEPVESASAVSMQLMKTEGTVDVTNGSGRSLTKRDNMRLYNGYHVDTEAVSYAWINLDDTKLTKLDEASEAEVRKSGKELELLLNSGSLFFNVTRPLEGGETLNIRTSTMVAGIRGTSGWIRVTDRWATEIYILEGTVEVSVTDPVTAQVKTAELQSGEKVIATAYPQNREGDKCDIILERFDPDDIDGFVLMELAEDSGLRGKILEASGMDVGEAAGAAQERLERDQWEMREKLDRIEDALAKQDNNISAVPVWVSGNAQPSTPANSGSDDSRSDDSNDSGSSSPAVIDSGVCGPDLRWILTKNGILTISGTGDMTDFAMLSAPWYKYRDMIKTVETGGNATSIGAWAFTNCTSLTGVNIGGSVKSIGFAAFTNCTSLTGVDIPASVTVIEDAGFSNCTGLTGVNIPNSVTSIGKWAFQDCTSLTSVDIPAGVTSIEHGAFWGCTSLTGVNIGSSVASIGALAFSDCAGLTGVNIPASVTSIGSQAFEGCGSLSSVVYAGSRERWENISGVDAAGIPAGVVTCLG